jgi:maltose-binding protein MalE
MESILSRQQIRGITVSVAALLAVASAGRTEPLTVLLMPLQPPVSNQTPFTAESHPFPHLAFRNTSAEFQRLNVGHQKWACKLLNDFGQRYSEKINVQFLSWETALVDIQAGWKSADVFQVPSTWTALLISQDMLAPVESLARERCIEGLVSSCRLDGRNEVYAVPWIVDFRVLFFRTDLARNPDELATFDGLVKCLERRRGEKVESKGAWQAPLGIALYRNWELMHGPIAYFCQGDILRKRRKTWQPAFHEGQARKGLEKLWLLARNDLAHLVTYDETNSPDQGDVLAVGLLEGKWDCVLGWPAMRGYFEWQGSPVRAAPLPPLFNRKYQFIGGSHLGVSAAANQRGNEQLASQLVQWLTSYEASVGLFQNTPCLPANAQALDQFIREHPQWSTFSEIVADGKPYPSIPKWAKSVEQDVTLNAFYFILGSMASKQDWPVVAGQIEAAAASLKEPDWSRPARVSALLALALTVLFILLGIPYLRRHSLLRKIESQLDGIERQLDKLTDAMKPEPLPSPAPCAAENVFRRAGQSWVVSFRGRPTFYIKDCTGMRYIAQLLGRPYKTISAVELVEIVSKQNPKNLRVPLRSFGQPDGDASEPRHGGEGIYHGQKIDLKALRSYKARLDELKAELEEAEENSDLASQESIRQEIEQIRAQIAEARESFTSVPRKAYEMVKQAIRRALKEIEKSDKELATHLRNSLKTGQECSYGPETPVHWEP